jgi:Glycosyl transferase family 2
VKAEGAVAAGVAEAVHVSPTRPTISVVIPVVERARALDEMYEELAPAIRELASTFEFVFVVNSWAVPLASSLERLRSAGEPIRVLELGQRSGETAMLSAAVDHLTGEIVITVPTYRFVRPETFEPLVDAVLAGADLATAKRLMDRASFINRIQNRVFHFFLVKTAGGGFSDIASGVRAVRASVLASLPLYGDSFRFLPLLLAAEGFDVCEVAVRQDERDARTKIYSPGVYLRRLLDLLGIFFLVRFTQKPLRFFGLIGSAFAASGGLILLILFIQRLGGRAIADRPLLLLGVLLFALGVQAIGIGLVGEIIVHFEASRRRLYRVRAVDGTAAAAGSTTPDSEGAQSRP